MLDSIRRIHLIGIGGIGVSAVARMLHYHGFEVQGSDVRESCITTTLREMGMTVTIGHAESNLDSAELVVVSTAIPETNPELMAARKRGMQVVHRSEVLGALMARSLSVGVIGTHGKGTVTSMIAWILKVAKRDPSYIIGAMCHNLESNAFRGQGPCVAEVDESDGSLVNTHPELVVLNNLELDHLNYYPSWDKLVGTMTEFFVDNPKLQHAFVNMDDVGVCKLVGNLQDVPFVGFGITNTDADYLGTEPVTEGMVSRFGVTCKGESLGEITLRVPGLYNVHNALGAIACTHGMGIAFEDIQEALSTFKGLENRFTLVETGGIQIVKDYISHPTGIQRVLEAARGICSKQIHTVFKPYRFTMIHYLQDEYRDCFRDADHTIITKMYTAGEVPIPGVDTPFLCEKIRESGSTVTYIPAMDDIVGELKEKVQPGEMVIFFGGDDLFELADEYIQGLQQA